MIKRFPFLKIPLRSRFFRDPLFHFLVLGALIFGIDHVLTTRRGDGMNIAVSQSVQRDIVALFRVRNKREPNADERAALIDRWIEAEALYREGLAQGLDRSDQRIRDMVISDTTSVIQSSLTVPPIAPDDLRAWFELHRAKYDRPGNPASFESLSEIIRRDWTEETVTALRAAAIRDTAAKFSVTIEQPDK